MKDFRPISLITSVYKILAKVLANWVKRVLPSTISNSKGAFVAGRQILDQALGANEAVEDYKFRKMEGVLFKIDFEKAYDHMDWNFLDKIMEKKGFGCKWRMWMWGCLRSVGYSFLINGGPRGKVVATRGLRQGDPLSPFLFLLVVNVLSRIVGKFVEGNIFEPFKVGKDKVVLSHLQFADDTLFFYSGNENSFFISNHVLAFFEEMSGLRINKGKCSVMGINCDEEKFSKWAELVGCDIGGLYLPWVPSWELP